MASQRLDPTNTNIIGKATASMSQNPDKQSANQDKLAGDSISQ